MDTGSPTLGIAALRATPYWAVYHRRIGAALADLLLLSALQLGLCQVFGVVGSGSQGSLFGGDGTDSGYVAGLSMLSAFWLAVIAVGYFTLFEGLFTATPGK